VTGWFSGSVPVADSVGDVERPGAPSAGATREIVGAALGAGVAFVSALAERLLAPSTATSA
jgi:hypothetical protein